MSTKALTRAELIEFIRANFDPEDIWQPYELETDHEDCYMDLAQALDAAEDEGWVNPQDSHTFEIWHLEQMTEHLGLTLGPQQRTIDAYHDDNAHTGAVQWCTDPLCAGE